MDVCRECCVLSGRGLCNELITRPEESYRLLCVVGRSATAPSPKCHLGIFTCLLCRHLLVSYKCLCQWRATLFNRRPLRHESFGEMPQRVFKNIMLIHGKIEFYLFCSYLYYINVNYIPCSVSNDLRLGKFLFDLFPYYILLFCSEVYSFNNIDKF
jgi:hypothetical protein